MAVTYTPYLVYMTQTISTIVDQDAQDLRTIIVYMTQTISTIVDTSRNSLTSRVYMTQTISTIVDMSAPPRQQCLSI